MSFQKVLAQSTPHSSNIQKPPTIRVKNNFIIFRRVKKECIDAVIGRSYVGDWLLFYLLGQNIDSAAYKVIISV